MSVRGAYPCVWCGGCPGLLKPGVSAEQQREEARKAAGSGSDERAPAAAGFPAGSASTSCGPGDAALGRHSALLSTSLHPVLTSTITGLCRAFQIINVAWISFPSLIVRLIFHTSYFDPGFRLLPNHY